MEQEKYLIRPGIKILGNYGLPETILLIFIIHIPVNIGVAVKGLEYR